MIAKVGLWDYSLEKWSFLQPPLSRLLWTVASQTSKSFALRNSAGANYCCTFLQCMMQYWCPSTYQVFLGMDLGWEFWHRCDLHGQSRIALRSILKMRVMPLLSYFCNAMRGSKKISLVFNVTLLLKRIQAFVLITFLMTSTVAKKSRHRKSGHLYIPRRPVEGSGVGLIVRGWAVSPCGRRRKGSGGRHEPRSGSRGPDGSDWSAYRRPKSIQVWIGDGHMGSLFCVLYHLRRLVGVR